MPKLNAVFRLEYVFDDLMLDGMCHMSTQDGRISCTHLHDMQLDFFFSCFLLFGLYFSIRVVILSFLVMI